jgi:hypothetical protein
MTFTEESIHKVILLALATAYWAIFSISSHEHFDDLLNDPNDGTVDPSTPGYEDNSEADPVIDSLLPEGFIGLPLKAREKGVCF